MHRHAITVVLVIFVSSGCASQPPRRVVYAQAEPKDDIPPETEPAVAIAGGLLTPGEVAPLNDQWRRRPSAEDNSKPSSISEVIDKANRAAAQEPDETAFFNAIQKYDYSRGTIYRIYTAPLYVTDIQLRPGERLVGQPVSGDTVRWVLGVGKSVEGGVEQQHVYLKPTRPGLATNLVLNTNQRTYVCEVKSFKETYMAGVFWNYPQEELASMVAHANDEAEARKTTTPVGNLANLNFGYRVKVMDGKPKWTPTQVFDDGAKTFIRFPRAMLVRDAPALFVLRDDKTQLVNYHVKRDVYVIDRLIDSAELRLGQDDEPEVVRIERERTE